MINSHVTHQSDLSLETSQIQPQLQSITLHLSVLVWIIEIEERSSENLNTLTLIWLIRHLYHVGEFGRTGNLLTN